MLLFERYHKDSQTVLGPTGINQLNHSSPYQSAPKRHTDYFDILWNSLFHQRLGSLSFFEIKLKKSDNSQKKINILNCIINCILGEGFGGEGVGLVIGPL